MSETIFMVDKDNLEVRTERTFKATPQRLWQALTDSEQIQQWGGPRGLTTEIDKNDVVVGGEWRYVQTGKDGSKYGFSGKFTEVDEPNKLVSTFEFEPMPGHVLIQTATFEPQSDGTTKFITAAKYANLADLEGMVSMGMEGGQRDSMDRMAELVETA